MPDMGQWSQVKYSVTRLGGGQTSAGVTFPGGLDLTTPSLALQPGALRDGVNFECSQAGGYARIEGYERYDGRASPSDASYELIQLSSFVTVPSVGDTVVQDNSSATGDIIAVNNVAGEYYIAVTNVVGVFNHTDIVFGSGTPFIVTASNSPQTITTSLTVSANIIGTATVPTVAISSLLNATYTAAAADNYRAMIGAVPGAGPILGVVGLAANGLNTVYAFRENEAGTEVDIYKTTVNGWVNVPLQNTVNFTLGATATPTDGDTLTQGGVTALISRVMTQSGTYAGGTAAGSFVISNPSGGSFHSGAATTTSGATVTLAGAEAQITLLPGGKFEFVKCNFTGSLSTRRIYGCDGVNKCFEFDGITLAPITTGLSPDAPSHITFHKNYLFISQASSILYCAVGQPFRWLATDGGGEIATGDLVTGLSTLPGSQTSATLGVYLRGNISFLYGTDPTTFNYVSFNTGTGALPYSVQNLFDAFLFDDLGIITLKTTLNFGNFAPSTLTQNIYPFIAQERSKLVWSSLNRTKGQYRVWFNDGYGLWLTTVNQSYLGAGIVKFPNPLACSDDMDLIEGGSANFFGSSDGLGYIYMMDTGTSFDGENIDAYITLAWDAIRSPRILKRFRAASIEIQGSTYAQISFGYLLAYGSPNVGQPNNVVYASNFLGSAVWDAFTWDQFFWDGRTLLPTDVDMTGTAENVQVILSSTTNYIGAYNVNSVIYHWSQRRGMRV